MKEKIRKNIGKLGAVLKKRKWHVVIAGVLIVALTATLILTVGAATRDTSNGEYGVSRPGDGQDSNGDDQGQDDNSQDNQCDEDDQGDRGNGDEQDNQPTETLPTVTPESTPSPVPSPTPVRTPSPTPQNTSISTPSPTPTIPVDGRISFNIGGGVRQTPCFSGSCTYSGCACQNPQDFNVKLWLVTSYEQLQSTALENPEIYNFVQSRRRRHYNADFFRENAVVILRIYEDRLGSHQINELVRKGNGLTVKFSRYSDVPGQITRTIPIEVRHSDVVDVERLKYVWEEQ